MVAKLAPVIGDRVQIRPYVDCGYCLKYRKGAAGRTGRIVTMDPSKFGLPASLVPPDHSFWIEYDHPWDDGEPGLVRRQFFAASELVIL